MKNEPMPSRQERFIYSLIHSFTQSLIDLGGKVPKFSMFWKKPAGKCRFLICCGSGAPLAHRQ